VSFLLLMAISALVFIAFALLALTLMRGIREMMADYRSTFTDTASDNMTDMFLFVDPQRLFYINLGLLVVLPPILWLITGDAVIGLAGLVALLILPKLMYNRLRKQRLNRFAEQLPDGLLMISGGLQAGASLTVAIQSLVKEQQPPLSQEFELFLREQKIGVEFGDALQHMEERLPIAEFQMISSALRISREVGGNLAEVLDTLADTLRRKAMMEGKIESLTAQGRMQGVVMAGLPILLGVLLYFLEPAAMSKMFNTWYGLTVLGILVVWEGIGFFLIRKVVAIDV